jgi:ATP-binding cassette subfamily A (ABC1) protein 3
MLTGMLQPTRGFAEVYGFDVCNRDTDEVRAIMGVCPQHDVLFDLLTPYEHLSVFQSFKGDSSDKPRSAEDKKKEIEDLIKDLQLSDFRNTEARALSGGNRRKLSVAIALCGDSKFIMLDEPTSGMDLQARRALWNMLKVYKSGKIILLTTHYMDEADVLGDRIGIMARGKLECLGTPLFLKNHYGVGYNLTLVKKEKDDNPRIMEFLKEQLGD